MINPIDWIKTRLDERTSWDGAMLILIGVITDVSSQIRGYLVSQNYESFKNS